MRCRSRASLSRKPVDIIIAIDNSGSMTAEIEGVQSNINRDSPRSSSRAAWTTG